ncbi:hypothetical protein C8A03DRAFT_39584, partial [Achaetomium macrosporum]
MSRPSSSGSNKSDGSNKSTDSYASVLSDDSYMATLRPIDNEFRNMLQHIQALNTSRSLAKQRKIVSHETKKRDPADTERRTDWTPQMEADYDAYKAKVDVLSAVKARQEASEKAAKASSKSKDLAAQERARLQALADDEAWLNAAIAAANARLGFMTKYPNALSTPSTQTHIKAVQDNLNSAKQAQREIQIQRQ